MAKYQWLSMQSHVTEVEGQLNELDSEGWEIFQLLHVEDQVMTIIARKQLANGTIVQESR